MQFGETVAPLGKGCENGPVDTGVAWKPATPDLMQPPEHDEGLPYPHGGTDLGGAGSKIQIRPAPVRTDRGHAANGDQRGGVGLVPRETGLDFGPTPGRDHFVDEIAGKTLLPVRPRQTIAQHAERGRPLDRQHRVRDRPVARRGGRRCRRTVLAKATPRPLVLDGWYCRAGRWRIQADVRQCALHKQRRALPPSGRLGHGRRGVEHDIVQADAGLGQRFGQRRRIGAVFAGTIRRLGAGRRREHDAGGVRNGRDGGKSAQRVRPGRSRRERIVAAGIENDQIGARFRLRQFLQQEVDANRARAQEPRLRDAGIDRDQEVLPLALDAMTGEVEHRDRIAAGIGELGAERDDCVLELRLAGIPHHLDVECEPAQGSADQLDIVDGIAQLAAGIGRVSDQQGDAARARAGGCRLGQGRTPRGLVHCRRRVRPGWRAVVVVAEKPGRHEGSLTTDAPVDAPNAVPVT